MSPSLSTKLCRGCLSCNANFLQPLFDNNLDELFRSVTSLDISEYDGLPQYVCVCCANRLFEYNNFKMQCLSSDVELKTRLSAALTSENAPCVIDLTDNEEQLDKNEQNKSKSDTDISRYPSLKELLDRSAQPFSDSTFKKNSLSSKKKKQNSRTNNFISNRSSPSSSPTFSRVGNTESSEQRTRKERSSIDHATKDTENSSDTISTKEQNTSNETPNLALLNMWRPVVLLRRLHVEYDEEK